MWRAVNLPSRTACMQYCQERCDQLSGNPYWHSEAFTPDGKLMFVHFQNVLMSKGSRTLVGLSSGILMHAFDDQQKIHRCVVLKRPWSGQSHSIVVMLSCKLSASGDSLQAHKQSHNVRTFQTLEGITSIPRAGRDRQE